MIYPSREMLLDKEESSYCAVCGTVVNSSELTCEECNDYV